MLHEVKSSKAVQGAASASSQQSYSQLKAAERTYRVVVFGGILVCGQGFGHSIAYILSARNEAQAISMALRKYNRRPNALPIHEARITHIDNLPACLTSAQDAQ